MKKRIAIAIAMAGFALSGFAHAGLREGIAAYESKDYSTARTELEPLVATREPAALYYFGRIELSRKDGNPERGVGLIRNAAELGYPVAMTAMGNFFLYGNDRAHLEITHRLALEWFEKAAIAGDAKGKLALANCLATCADAPRDSRRAIRLMEELIDAGSSDAMLRLGRVYRDGSWALPAPDMDRARRLFEAAAKTDHVSAMLALGLLLRDRIQPPQPEAAFNWIKKAADRGDTSARYHVGLMLLKGEGAPMDDVAARAMFEATERGYLSEPLALLQYEGRAGFTASEKGSIELYRSLYKDGQKDIDDSDVLVHLATMALGKEFSRPDLAFRIFQSLALQGNASGKLAVAAMTFRGKGTSVDEAKGKLQLASLRQTEKHSFEATWAGYVLSDHAYRLGNFREAANVLPDIFDKDSVRALVQKDGNLHNLLPDIPEYLLAIIYDGKEMDSSWPISLALREGGSGPISWAVKRRRFDPSTVDSSKDISLVLTAKEEEHWAKLVDEAANENPELLALLALKTMNAEKCIENECNAALKNMKLARTRGSILARAILASLYLSDGESQMKFRAELGIARDEKYADQMLKELEGMGVTRIKKDDLK